MSSDLDNDWEELSSDASEESGSDWELTRKKGRKNLKGNSRSPAKKRARLSISNNVGKRMNGHKSLSILLSMPMDILFEVFRRLSPKDLILLTRTNKLLRQTLLTPNAVTVWKGAREGVKAPQKFDDFSEPRWALLLFGSTVCQCCGATNVFKIDFKLRRRVCVRCKKSNLVFASKFSSKFPDYEDIILDFIPHTNVGGWAHGHASGSKFYWASDIEDMAYRWGQLTKAVHMRTPGAKQKLDDFKSERTDFVNKVLEHADVCDDWLQAKGHERSEEERIRRENRYNAIIERFASLGYVPVDIKCIQYEKQAQQDSELTDRIWSRIRPILEPIIQAGRSRRLAKERAALVMSRIRIIGSLYKSYLKTLQPSQWFFQPSISEVCELPEFKELVQAGDDITVDAASFAKPLEMLPGLIVAWTEERRKTLLELLDTSSKASTGTSSGVSLPQAGCSALSSATTTGETDSLTLATSVFECGQDCRDNTSPWGTLIANCLVAWEGVNTHQCKEYAKGQLVFSHELEATASKYKFSPIGSATAATLISLTGLKVDCATPADMDQRDPLFFCKTCGPQNHARGIYGRVVYTWRSAIGHAVARHSADPATWMILTAVEVANVKRLESADPVQRDRCWVCNHCNIHLDSCEPHIKVVEHLEMIHNLKNWSTPRDLFIIPQKRRSRVLFYVFAMTSCNKVMRCKRCPANSSRLFDVGGVRSHLRDKHKVGSPVENVDWIETSALPITELKVI